jgi:hypothetical protein
LQSEGSVPIATELQSSSRCNFTTATVSVADMKIRRYTQVGYGSAISGDQLTTANGEPAISPDGRYVAFAHGLANYD